MYALLIVYLCTKKCYVFLIGSLHLWNESVKRIEIFFGSVKYWLKLEYEHLKEKSEKQKENK